MATLSGRAARFLECLVLAPLRRLADFIGGPDRVLRRQTAETVRSWTPPIRRAKVLECVDGGTVVLAAVIDGVAYRFRCRLARVHAPCLRPSAHLTRREQEDERRAARIALDALQDLVLGRVVGVSDVRNDRMTQIRAELTLDGDAERVSDHMIRSGLVVPYTRGTRAGWDWANFPLEQRNPFHLAPEA